MLNRRHKTFITSFSNVALLLASSIAFGADIGATYAIEEPDVLQEIQEHARTVDWRAVMSKSPSQWSGWGSEALPAAAKTSEHFYKPFFTLDTEIPDKDGQILYPKGFRFNPLDHYLMPGRVLVIAGEQHIAWLQQNIKEGDVVITAGGDPKALGTALGRPVFTFDPRMKERFGVRAVPSIISQRGNSLVVREIHIKDPS